MSTPESQESLSIDDVFAVRGIALTRQRRAIWNHFAQAGRATTAAEAAEALKTQGIGKATVYRAVTLLNELGLLMQVHVCADVPCYTALSLGHAHPLICRVCRKVIDFDGEGDLHYLEKQLEATSGFAIYGHHLEVYGICPDCRAASGR